MPHTSTSVILPQCTIKIELYRTNSPRAASGKSVGIRHLHKVQTITFDIHIFYLEGEIVQIPQKYENAEA